MIIRFTICILIFTYLISCRNNTKEKNCFLLRQGKFKYIGIPDTTAYILVNANTHTEIIKGGKDTLVSKLRWLNECQYRAQLISITDPELGYEPGDSLTITITKTKGKTIYYNAEINGDKWEGEILKVE